MTSRSRFRFFILLVAVFFIAAPLLTLWSRGYRLDTKSRTLVRAGAIFIKVNPENAKVRIEGIAQKKLKPRLLSDGYLVSNLLPDIYRVTVTKEGYYPWTKDLTVKPLQVTRSSKIVLFQEIPDIKPLIATSVASLWPAPGRNDLYLIDAQRTKLFLWNSDRADPPRKILDASAYQKEKIAGVMASGATDLLLILLTKDRIIFDTQKNKAVLFSQYLNTIGASQINLKHIFWDPNQSRELLGLTSDGRIYTFNLDAQTYKRLISERIIGHDKNAKVFLDLDGTVWRPDVNNGLAKSDEIKLPSPASPKRIPSYEMITLPQRQYILHDTLSGSAWVAERDRVPILIALNVDKVMPNPAQNKIAIFSRDQILSVYFLKDTTHDIFIPRGTTIKLGLTDAAVKDIFWLKNEWYLAIRHPEKMEIVEVDSRYPINRVSYPIAADEAIFRAAENSIIYIFQNTPWQWKLAQ